MCESWGVGGETPVTIGRTLIRKMKGENKTKIKLTMESNMGYVFLVCMAVNKMRPSSSFRPIQITFFGQTVGMAFSHGDRGGVKACLRKGSWCQSSGVRSRVLGVRQGKTEH